MNSDAANPATLDDDYYIGRWGELEVSKVEVVFPDAKPYGLDEMSGFSFRDAIGNQQFILGDQNMVGSHGLHILSPEQYRRLRLAGAKIY